MGNIDYFVNGMSENAVYAYECGRKPLSRITLSDLRREGWKESRSFAVYLAREGCWNTDEWHHTSSWFSISDFYDPQRLVEVWSELSDGERSDWFARYRKSASEKNAPVERVRGKFAEWGGSRNYPKLEKWVEFTGVLKGDWIILDETKKRKKASGNWIEYSVIR